MKVFDTVTSLYLSFEDYTQSLTNTGLLGVVRTVTAIATHTDSNAKFTSASHGLLTGQTVTIDDTTNYNGSYIVTVLDANTFVCEDCPYVADEVTGSAYPLMDSTYYQVFLHDIEDVFTKVKTISAVRGSAIRNKENNTLVGEFAMTEDRRDVFLLFAREVADKVFGKCSAYAKLIQNGYLFNSQVDFDADGSYALTGEESKYYIHMAISVAPTTVNINSYMQVNQTILDAIVYGVLAEWFRTKGSQEDYALYETRFTEALGRLSLQLGHAEGKRSIPMNNFF
jgi:hypothetical protein